MAISDRVNIILTLKNKMAQGLTKASAKLNQFAVRSREAGQAMAIGAAVMGAGIWKVTQLAVGLDDEMRKIQARIAGVTSGEMTDLRNMAKELGRTTSFTTAQVADLMATLAQGGKNAKEIQALTKPMLDLARATGITTGQAAMFTQQALASFGLGVEKAAHVADVLTYAANNSFQGVEDLGEALKFAGVISKQTGQSFESTIGSMAAMANVGIKGSMAGRQLRKVLVDLAGNGSAAAKKLGVAIEDSNGQVRALPLILADFMDATKDLTQLGRIKKFNEAFGKIGLNASMISGEAGVKIMKLAKELRRLDGTSKETAATMDGGPGGALRRLWSAVEGVAIAVGESLVPVIDSLSRGFTIIANAITPVLEKLTWLGPLIMGVFAALAIGGATLLTVAGMATILSAGFSAMAGALTLISGIFSTVFAGGGAVIAALASPLGIILGLLAAIAIATIDFGAVWNEVSTFAISQWNLISKTAMESFDGILAAFSKGDLELAFKIMMKGLEVIFAGTMDNLFSSWRNIGMAIVTFFGGVMRQINMAWGGAIVLMSRGIIWIQEKLGLVSSQVAAEMRKIADDNNTKNITDAEKQINDLEAWAGGLFNGSTDDRKKELAELIKQAKEVEKETLTMKQLFDKMFAAIKQGAMDMAEAQAAQQEAFNMMFVNAAKKFQAANYKVEQTSGAVGAFSAAGLASALAKSERDIMADSLVEHKTANTHLNKIAAALSNPISFWSPN